MARPRAKELTERELELMHVFWKQGELTAQDVRDELAKQGRDLAYTTVATLIRILSEKGFLSQVNEERPFRYKSERSFEEVSLSLVGDMVERVFGGSREKLLLRMFEERRLTERERVLLEKLLRERKP